MVRGKTVGAGHDRWDAGRRKDEQEQTDYTGDD